ncbi:MAG: hypothetical protein ACREAA_10280 [Candidatus Polarisedimenticolia bacterium]
MTLLPFLSGLSFSLALCAVVVAVVRRLPASRHRQAAILGAACAAGFVLLFQNVLVHDALWYYSYLRSALFDADLDTYEEFVLRNPNGMYLPPPSTPVFHLGSSLLVTPLAIAVKPVAAALARHGVLPGGDGYGPLETGAYTFGSMMLAVAGIALTYRLARRFAGDSPAAIAAIAMTYATPLAWFAFIWPAYPHAATIFLGACFLLVWLHGEGEHGPGRLLLLGILAGALALVHPQDVVYLALPALDLLTAPGPSRWRSALKGGALLGGGTLLGVAPQIAAWIGTSGHPLPHVYADIGDPFIWSRPAFLQVLFSDYNGLFTWTPLCAVGAAGLFLLRREHPRLFRGALSLLVLEWWAIASYGYWWGGASFGARYFLSVWPVLALGFAMALAAAARRLGTLGIALASTPFVYWNLLLMAQFRLEWIEHNRPPRFREILERQIHEAPAWLLDGLTQSHGWNQVLVVEQVKAAIQDGSWGRMLGWLAAACAACGVIVGATLLLQREGRFRSWPAVALVCVIAATAGVAAVSRNHDATRLVAETSAPTKVLPGSSARLQLAAPPSGPTIDQPTATVSAPVEPIHGERLQLDLVTLLLNGGAVEEGQVVAWARLQGHLCSGTVFEIRAGLETAETAPDRFESRPFMKHGLEKTHVIQSWWRDNVSASHYWGHAYQARFDIPEGCRPSQVVVTTRKGDAIMEVRKASLLSTGPA